MTHSRPSFAGPLIPSTYFTWPSFTFSEIWQPTPQKGQTLSVSLSKSAESPTWAASSTVASISAPVGQACTHSPQATQVEAPMGSAMSKVGKVPCPRPDMPITSLTCTSRQARTHSPHWMQASRFTRIATWLSSSSGMRPSSSLGKRLSSTPFSAAMSHMWLDLSWLTACSGWSAISSSTTILRAPLARALSVVTTIPGAGSRMQLAASTRSPSISTMQARQLPSGR